MWTRRQFNVIHVGSGFLLLYTAFFGLSSIQKVLNVNISQDNPNYSTDGFIIQSLFYLTFALTFTIAPALLSIFGCRTSMVIGALSIGIYAILFSLEITWVSYSGTIVSGFGEALLWVAEGQYMVQNAHRNTLQSDTSLFWGIFIFSMSAGNILGTVKFSNLTRIDNGTRQTIYYTTTGMALVAALVFGLTGSPKGSLSRKKRLGPIQSICKTFEIAKTTDFAVLLVSSIFYGFQQSFGWGVYASCVGFTQQFGDMATQLVPLSSLVFGLGGCLGSFTNMYLYYRMNCSKRYLYYVGFLIEVLCYLGAVLNLPNASVFAPTYEASFIQKPKIWLALACAFGLGMSDSFIVAQLHTLIGLLHPDSSSQAISAFKFIKNISVSGFFFLSLVASLRVLSLVLAVVGCVCVLCFHWVDARVEKATRLEPPAERTGDNLLKRELP